MAIRPVKFKRERGFLTFAQNTKGVDYVRLAYALALSIKATQSQHAYLSIAVTPGQEVPEKYRWAFDEIIDIPWVDEAKNSDWKLENEWKAYHLTPYKETIKLDADMLFLADYSDWWDILAKNDISPTLNVRTYKDALVSSDYYRKTFTSNELPNVYSGFFFFKQSDAVLEFFDLIEQITHNWEMFSYEFLDNTRPAKFSTDVAYALALKIIDNFGEYDTGIETCPTFVHMKSRLQNWNLGELDENWMKYVGTYFTPELNLKVDLQTQYYPFHYHLKEFLTDEILDFLEDRVDAK